MLEVMQIDIVSDAICPWCYIGKRRFERALATYPDAGSLAITWWPFQLNPTMPPEGMERGIYLAEKFGSAAQAADIYRQVEAAGRREGISFAFDKMMRTPNTLESHRLIGFAAIRGVQNEMVEVLFRGYFEQGKDIGQHDILLAAAQEVGLDDAETRAFLAGDEGRQEIAANDVAARQLGISGVPCFIVDRRFAISGAHEPEIFLRALQMAAQGSTPETLQG
jgi:predicted DsbA family dithiol-disulfide isomerase